MSDELTKLVERSRASANDLVGVQEDLPSGDDRGALGLAAHLLEKQADEIERLREENRKLRDEVNKMWMDSGGLMP